MSQESSMDGETRAEIAAIKDAINEVKRLINLLFDREETRLSRLNEVERDFALHSQACAGNQAIRKTELDTVWSAIRGIQKERQEDKEAAAKEKQKVEDEKKNAPKDRRATWQFWIWMVTAVSGWGYTILKSIGVIK